MTFNRDEFRVQLLLALPDMAFRRLPASDAPEFDTVRRDTDYDAEALAAFVLEQLDTAVAAGVADEAAALPEVVSIASAAGVASTAAEVAVYLDQLSAVLKRNMAIAEQWDLARTIAGEAARLRGVVHELISAHPTIVAAAQPLNEAPSLILPGS